MQTEKAMGPSPPSTDRPSTLQLCSLLLCMAWGLGGIVSKGGCPSRSLQSGYTGQPQPQVAQPHCATLSSSSLTCIWRKVPIQVTEARSCWRLMAPMFSQSFWMSETTSSQLNCLQAT